MVTAAKDLGDSCAVLRADSACRVTGTERHCSNVVQAEFVQSACLSHRQTSSDMKGNAYLVTEWRRADRLSSEQETFVYICQALVSADF
jgi:hypothetical protein